MKELRKGLRFFQGNPALVMSLMEKWVWMYQRVKSEMYSVSYQLEVTLPQAS